MSSRKAGAAEHARALAAAAALPAGGGARMLNSPPSALRARMLVQGRATVQLIEAAQVLLTDSAGWSETALLKVAIALYQNRLRRMLAVLPPDWSADILAASASARAAPGAERTG